jgi:hypothetical protein
MATHVRQVERGHDRVQTLKLAPPAGEDKSILKQVDIGELQVDRTYQPANRQRDNRVRYLAENWEEVLGGTLSVSLRDGRMWVFDGATRLAGARENGSILVLPCRVYLGLTQAQEARAFRLLNQWRWAVHVVDRFNAMLVEEDPRALELREALSAHGLRIGYTPGVEEISAIQALEFVKLWGVLPDTLSIITQAWPDDPFARRREMVLAIGAFVFQYQALYSEVLFKRMLRHLSPSKLVDDAASASRQRSKWASVADELVYLYNRIARQENRRLLHKFEKPRLQRTGVSISKQADNNMPGSYKARKANRGRRPSAAAV